MPQQIVPKASSYFHKASKLLLIAALGAMLAGCKVDVYSKLSEREANEMIALLSKNGIQADRSISKDGTSHVRVEETQLSQAIDTLKASGLPRRTFTNMGEVFKSSGLISSPTEERARFIYALSEELSRTISDIDGVLSARIHVVLPKNDLLRQDATPSSASVFIRHDARAPLKSLLPHIKMLVANSIEGLSYEKVSVVLVPVERLQPVPGEAANAPAAPAASRTGRLPDSTVANLSLGAGGLGLATLAGLGAYWFGRRRRPDPEASPPAAAASGANPPVNDADAPAPFASRSKPPAAEPPRRAA